MEETIATLQVVIEERNYNPRHHEAIVINENGPHKERQIIKPDYFPEQIMHHVAVQALHPCIMHGMGAFVLGSIPGRGAHYGKRYVEKWLRHDEKNTRNEAVMDEYLEKYGAKAETVRMTHGRALDFMGFEFHRDRTVLRKSIMISATRKAARIGAAHRINWVEAAGMLSYMGWIDHTNTYAMYLEWVKPYVNIKRLKKIISNHQRRLNNGIDLQNRQGLPADAPGGARSHVEPGQGVSAS